MARLGWALVAIAAWSAADEATAAEAPEGAISDPMTLAEPAGGARVGFDFRGLFHVGVTGIDGEREDAVSVNRQQLDLTVRAALAPGWDLFFAHEFTRGSDVRYDDPGRRLVPAFDLDTNSETVIAWGEYRYSDALNVRLGRFRAPHGIINREHFADLLVDAERPGFLTAGGILPTFMSGVELHGELSSGRVGYELATGVAAASPEHFNVAARAARDFRWGGEIGVNLGLGERRGDQKYSLYGLDVRAEYGRFLWQIEAFATDEEGRVDGRRGGYAQAGFRFRKGWLAWYRFDYLDSGLILGEHREHALGLHYRPNQRVLLRARVARREFAREPGFDAAVADSFQASATFSF